MKPSVLGVMALYALLIVFAASLLFKLIGTRETAVLLPPQEETPTTPIVTYDMGDGVRCYRYATISGTPTLSCVQVWKQFAEEQ